MVSMREQSHAQEDTGGSSDSNAMVEMCAAMDELHCQKQTFEDNFLHIQQCQWETTPTKEKEIMDPYHLSDEIWEAPIPEGFKHSSLENFDACSDADKYVSSFIKVQMAIIRAHDSLKCKLLSRTFRDAALWWHMVKENCDPKRNRN